MEPTPEQRMSIERLYENESLTANLTDEDARAVLNWAQQQILADQDGALVRAAVSAANDSGEMGAQTLITQAANFLTQELNARSNQTASAPPAASTELQEIREMNARPMSAPDSTRLRASGASSEQRLLTASADATIGSPSRPASSTKSHKKKSRAKSKPKKK